MSDVTTLTDDANRQQSVSRIFYLLGDVLQGTDSSQRMPSGEVHDQGLLGPAVPGYDVGFGSGGEVFVRGRSGQIGTTSTTTPNGAAAGAGGFSLNPMTLVLIAGALFLVYKLAK